MVGQLGAVASRYDVGPSTSMTIDDGNCLKLLHFFLLFVFLARRKVSLPIS